MSESELDNFGRSRSLRRLRHFFRKSLPFQKFPSLQTLRTHEDDDEEELLDSQSLDHPGSSIPSIGAELRQLHERLGRLKRQVMEIKEKNTADLSEMSAVIKRGMERVELFGEQLDDFDQYVQVDKDNIQNQMEEMEAKIHHQINDQYSDLQEAIEGLYLRMDTLEKIYEEQKQQRDIEEKEASYARNLAVKIINMFICLTQVILLVLNTIAETLRPLTSNGANLAIIIFVLYLIATLSDDEVGRSIRRLFGRVLPGLSLWEVNR
ncbi:uncharacterized protein LOC122394295 [Amphibalanus amphitrite]|uniref:uncharacterized protein LOC122394295 n=1 Tax=Amphibalanus amphitrite TaxID=1232801 RepID=UPI001C91568E|nr:uncharacterized protein LOC122394295 [Amphibalanus amphitrite]